MAFTLSLYMCWLYRKDTWLLWKIMSPAAKHWWWLRLNITSPALNELMIWLSLEYQIPPILGQKHYQCSRKVVQYGWKWIKIYIKMPYFPYFPPQGALQFANISRITFSSEAVQKTTMWVLIEVFNSADIYWWKLVLLFLLLIAPVSTNRCWHF